MGIYTLRAAEPSDGQFLAEMIVEAANWRAAGLRPRVSVLADPEYARYLSGWSRPSDRGVVAVTDEGTPVGAAWFRLFGVASNVDRKIPPGVPELIIGVKPPWRSQGVGRALLQSLIAHARSSGFARIALSVETGNFAESLYRSEQFVTVAASVERRTMVRLLH